MSKEKDLISEQELVERARQSANDLSLPDNVQRRLRLARAEAVAHMDERRSLFDTVFGGARWLIPAGAAATLVLAVTLIGTNQTELMPLMNEQELAAASDMELLDDIEFLAWMLEEENNEDLLDDG